MKPLPARRAAFGLSQAELATQIGISRQALSAIETGQSVPGVDVALRLAHALDCSVEDLFSAPEPASMRLDTPPRGVSGRYFVTEVGNRRHAHPLDGEDVLIPADAIEVPRSTDPADHATEDREQYLDLIRPWSRVHTNLTIMGCSPALALIAARFNQKQTKARCLWIPSSNAAALQALFERSTHLSSFHANETLDLDNRAVEIVSVARWQIGWLSRSGERFVGIDDLSRDGLKIAHREPGAAVQSLLLEVLEQLGLGRCLVPQLRLPGHLLVARAIAERRADVGIASRDAALAYGLHFVPIREERVDLCFLKSHRDRVAPLVDELSSSAFRRQLDSLGYDTTSTGTLLSSETQP